MIRTVQDLDLLPLPRLLDPLPHRPKCFNGPIYTMGTFSETELLLWLHAINSIEERVGNEYHINPETGQFNSVGCLIAGLEAYPFRTVALSDIQWCMERFGNSFEAVLHAHVLDLLAEELPDDFEP